ncbi:hypothetical protein BG011_006950 [Mortierella polycephala]|uniref:AD domain-containing protein n=1 Tax=Mortierella polycephala TaxID=41804 RepID=A0A9P6PTY5_9FUNG|nr:hypothetical protein BG011_006950 [Mortierella polycephala]
METLNKKTPVSFASAAAGNIPSTSAATTPTAATAAAAPSGTSGPATKNGSNASSNQSSPALGSQSPALASTSPGVDKAPASSASLGNIDWTLGLSVKVVTLADEVFEGQVYAFDPIMNCVCPSKSISASSTPAAYYSPSLGNMNAAPRQKYDFRILKINYIKDVTSLSSPIASNDTTGKDSSATTTTSIKSNNGSTMSSPKPSTSELPSGESKGSKEGEKNNINNVNNITSNPYSTVLPAAGYVQLDKIQQREQQAVRDAQAAAARIGVGVSSIGQDIFDALSKTLPCRWANDQIVVMDEVIIAPPYEPENCKANASSSYTLARVKKVLEGERMRLANGRK